MARKTILVCDKCSKEVAEGRGALMRLNFTDARRGSKQADLCDDCAGGMPGHAVARRGRRPKAVSRRVDEGAVTVTGRDSHRRFPLFPEKRPAAYERESEAGITMD